MDAKQVRGWDVRFEQMMDRFGGCFARRDLRRQAAGYVRGLLGRMERKNGWQLAEHLGREKPYGIQRLMGRASWNADDVRDELVRYATTHLVTDGDPGVLIVDETGFLKKASSPSVCSDSTAARPAESRTARSASFWRWPHHGVGH